MGDVVELDIVTSLPIPAERVLRKAIENGMRECVVVGLNSDGQSYFASSMPSSSAIIYYLERAKFDLLKMEDHIAETATR